MYNHGPSPAVIFDDLVSERSEDECSNSGAAERQAGGQRAPSLEVESDSQHRRHVDHAETDTWRIINMHHTTLQE